MLYKFECNGVINIVRYGSIKICLDIMKMIDIYFVNIV